MPCRSRIPAARSSAGAPPCNSATVTEATDLGAQQREIWDRIAPFWADHRAQAPDPRVEWTPPLPEQHLQGARVLELGCGAGERAVEMAAAGANVLATDVSPTFVELASARAARDDRDLMERVSTAVVDATDPSALAQLEGSFDLVVADMVLMNLVDLRPLAGALPRLLGNSGRFVVTLLHPCFPSPFFVDIDEAGRPIGGLGRVVGFGQRVAAHVPARLISAVSIALRPLITRPRPYLSEVTRRVAVAGQPEPHFNVHRSIGTLLAPFLDAGLVVHGLSEGTGEGRAQPSLLWLDLRSCPS